MSGLDKIISRIEEEAKSSADRIIQEANEKADAIRGETDKACRAADAEAQEKSGAAREDILRKSRSAAQMQQRRALLQAKQELIGEVIEEAKASIHELEGKEYFALITEMLDKYVQAGRGEICFNQKDLNRLPEGYEQVIADAAARKGGELTLSKEPCRIDGGFLLVYGGVEENCSFASMFAGARESLQDKIHAVLFG